MKVSKRQLRRIIREERSMLLAEQGYPAEASQSMQLLQFGDLWAQLSETSRLTTQSILQVYIMWEDTGFMKTDQAPFDEVAMDLSEADLREVIGVMEEGKQYVEGAEYVVMALEEALATVQSGPGGPA